MDIKEVQFINFAAQIGSWEAENKVGLHLTVLNKLLNKYCNYLYSPDLKEIGPVFRIDGEIHHWDKEGLDRLRLAKKQRYITVDIMMPRSRWEGVSPLEIRRFLNENFKAALHLMVNRLKKEHIEVDEERLFEDYAKVEKEFLSANDLDQTGDD
jgi:hypothetical protein